MSDWVFICFHMLVGDWDSNAPVVFWIDVLQWVNYYVVCKKLAFWYYTIEIYTFVMNHTPGQPAHPGDPGRWHGLQYRQRPPLRRPSLARFPGAARKRCPLDGRAGLRLSAWACGRWVRKLERLVKLAEFWGWTLVVLLSSFNSICYSYRNDCHYLYQTFHHGDWPGGPPKHPSCCLICCRIGRTRRVTGLCPTRGHSKWLWTFVVVLQQRPQSSTKS